MFKRLRYFVAVAEELNFRRASDRLNITQPALWRQIRELERGVEAKLFTREPSGMELTEAGRGYLEDARRILQLLEEANGRARRVEQGEVGMLRIAFNEIAARARYLPECFQGFRSQFPDIELQLSVMMSQQQLDALERREIDAGFLFHRPAADALLDHHPILDDDHLIALPKGHRLSSAARLHLRDLADEKLIMPSPLLNRALHGRLLSACLAGGLTPHVVQHADNEHTLLNMVAVGMGIAFVNTSCQARYTREVVYRAIEDFSVPVRLDLVWRRDNASAALAHFIGMVATLPTDTRPAEADRRPRRHGRGNANEMSVRHLPQASSR